MAEDKNGLPPYAEAIRQGESVEMPDRTAMQASMSEQYVKAKQRLKADWDRKVCAADKAMSELLEEEATQKERPTKPGANSAIAAHRPLLPAPGAVEVSVGPPGGSHKGGKAGVSAVSVAMRWSAGADKSGWEARRAQVKIDGTERPVLKLAERAAGDRAPFAATLDVALPAGAHALAVRVARGKGEWSEWSEPASFEMGGASGGAAGKPGRGGAGARGEESSGEESGGGDEGDQDDLLRLAPPPRTNRPRRVLHPVLLGHAASYTPF